MYYSIRDQNSAIRCQNISPFILEIPCGCRLWSKLNVNMPSYTSFHVNQLDTHDTDGGVYEWLNGRLLQRISLFKCIQISVRVEERMAPTRIGEWILRLQHVVSSIWIVSGDDSYGASPTSSAAHRMGGLPGCSNQKSTSASVRGRQ